MSAEDLREVRVAAAAAAVAFPAAGVWRVHQLPGKLHALHESPAGGEPIKPGPNRFDSPNGDYVVRYLGERLTGCLLEILAWLKPRRPTETGLAAVDGVDDPSYAGRPDPTPTDGVTEFLRTRRVARFTIAADVEATLVDVYDGGLVSALGRDRRIWQTCQRDPVRDAFAGPGGTVHLDESLIRNAHSDVGRPVTQAISWVLLGLGVAHGLRYTSRHDDAETCWALAEGLAVDVHGEVALDPSNIEHQAAVRHAAARHGIILPAAWRP